MSRESITKAPLAWGIREFSAALGVSASLIRLEIARGRLRPAHVGRRVVIPAIEAQRYLEMNQRPERVAR
jgi:hypothetical protein